MTERKSNTLSALYDLIFGTSFKELGESDQPLITAINEIFGEKLSSDSQVTMGRHKQLTVTDKETGERKSFLVEVQTVPDAADALPRIFENALGAGLEDGSVCGANVDVTLPQTAVFCLCSGKNQGDIWKTTIKVPGGIGSYDTKLVQLADYDLDTIFAKKVYLFLPLYLYSQIVHLDTCENYERRCEQLFGEVKRMCKHLNGLLLLRGEITKGEYLFWYCMLDRVTQLCTENKDARMHELYDAVYDILWNQCWPSHVVSTRDLLVYRQEFQKLVDNYKAGKQA